MRPRRRGPGDEAQETRSRRRGPGDKVKEQKPRSENPGLEVQEQAEFVQWRRRGRNAQLKNTTGADDDVLEGEESRTMRTSIDVSKIHSRVRQLAR